MKSRGREDDPGQGCHITFGKCWVLIVLWPLDCGNPEIFFWDLLIAKNCLAAFQSLTVVNWPTKMMATLTWSDQDLLIAKKWFWLFLEIYHIVHNKTKWWQPWLGVFNICFFLSYFSSLMYSWLKIDIDQLLSIQSSALYYILPRLCNAIVSLILFCLKSHFIVIISKS